MRLRNFDFVYTDDRNEKKYIASVEDMRFIKSIEFEVHSGRKCIYCILDTSALKWQLEIPSINARIELSTLDDEFWNSEQIIEKVRDYHLGIAIAKAIKEINIRHRRLINI